MSKYVVMTIALVLLALSLHCMASGLSVSQSKDGIVFSMSLTKASFVEGEPVIATFRIRNNGETDRKLAEPTLARYHVVECDIFGYAGEKAIRMGAGVSYSYPPLPADYGWMFRAEET